MFRYVSLCVWGYVCVSLYVDMCVCLFVCVCVGALRMSAGAHGGQRIEIPLGLELLDVWAT